MTMMLSPRRNGSGKKAAGRRKTSELVPSAWPVDDPSKFHSLSSSTDLIGPSRVYIRKGNKGDLCQFAVSLFFAGDGNRVGKQVEARNGSGTSTCMQPRRRAPVTLPFLSPSGTRTGQYAAEDEVRR
jgi:hypothetical protein